MRVHSFFLTLLLLAVLVPTGRAAAAECGQAPITDKNRKFSVFLPKDAGLGEQSYADIACAVISRNAECASRQMSFDSGAVAHDFTTGEAVPAEKAYFVLGTDVATPAGYGIVAFREKAEAEKFSAEHGKGKVVTWWKLVNEKLK